MYITYYNNTYDSNTCPHIHSIFVDCFFLKSMIYFMNCYKLFTLLWCSTLLFQSFAALIFLAHFALLSYISYYLQSSLVLLLHSIINHGHFSCLLYCKFFYLMLIMGKMQNPTNLFTEIEGNIFIKYNMQKTLTTYINMYKKSQGQIYSRELRITC